MRSEATRRKQTPHQRLSVRKRRARRRNYVIGGTIVLVIVAAIVTSQVLGSRASNEFNSLAKAQGCSEVRETSSSGSGEHLTEGERTEYDVSPPTHGEHQPTTLPEGIYDEPLSDDPTQGLNIYKSVHSLEHGAVVIWHDKLKKDDRTDLESEYRNEDKVLVVPYPPLEGDTKVALSAWGRMVTCDKSSPKLIDAFIDRFRGARTAPEPNNTI